MSHNRRLIGALFTTVNLAAGMLFARPAASLHASSHRWTGDSGAVFVQTNDPLGNAVAAYRRQANGKLLLAATYPTGGNGGREVGAMSDPLASQGSLLYDSSDGLLFAVNAGSNTVSVFGVQGATLRLHQIISSGGSFPVGFARHGNLLYVLNAGLTGDVSGYRIAGGRLHPISGSTRSLGLANTSPPFFLTSPGEAGFTPSGSHLVVTTKTNVLVEVFAVGSGGFLSSHPVRNPVRGLPFAFRFGAAGLLELVNAANGLTGGVPNAGTGSLATYTVNANGTLTRVSGPVSDGQTAACWITAILGFDYVANTGSGTISQYRVSASGSVALVNPMAAFCIAGPTDLATLGDELYNESGLSSTLRVYEAGSGGILTLIQSVPVPDGANQEGIVAV